MTITKQQSIEQQMREHPYIKPSTTDQMEMVVPGRRALGEDWVKVTLGHDADQVVIDSVPVEAPADRKPVFVVAGADSEYARYILEAQMEKARQRARLPHELSQADKYAALNEAWFNFIEEKLAFLKGKSSFGAGGGIQRQRVVQDPSTRPAHRK